MTKGPAAVCINAVHASGPSAMYLKCTVPFSGPGFRTVQNPILSILLQDPEMYQTGILFSQPFLDLNHTGIPDLFIRHRLKACKRRMIRQGFQDSVPYLAVHRILGNRPKSKIQIEPGSNPGICLCGYFDGGIPQFF